VHYAEDGGVEPDAERERRDDQQGDAGAACERASRVVKIGQPGT
jgi:hypothetical protein